MKIMTDKSNQSYHEYNIRVFFLDKNSGGDTENKTT